MPYLGDNILFLIKTSKTQKPAAHLLRFPGSDVLPFLCGYGCFELFPFKTKGFYPLTSGSPQQPQPRTRSYRPWGCCLPPGRLGSTLPWRDLPLKSNECYPKWVVCKMPDYPHKYLHVDKCGRKFFVHIVFLLYQTHYFLQVFLYDSQFDRPSFTLDHSHWL